MSAVKAERAGGILGCEHFSASDTKYQSETSDRCPIGVGHDERGQMPDQVGHDEKRFVAIEWQ